MRYSDDDDFLYWNRKEHAAIDKYWNEIPALRPSIEEDPEDIPEYNGDPPPVHQPTFYWQEGRFWDVDA